MARPAPLTGLLLTLCCGMAMAPSQVAADTLNCAQPADMVETRNCAAQTLERVDKQLNTLYHQRMDELSQWNEPQDQDRLRTAQRAWLRYRDLQCEHEALQFEGGRAEWLVQTNCLIYLTEQRNQALQRKPDDCY